MFSLLIMIQATSQTRLSFRTAALLTDTTYINSRFTNGNTYYFWMKATDIYCNPKTSN
ncbi:MAG: hypothetical protein LWX07_01275 [Bacteroidetes bacterium]|nr:hypothetical protein [Bacteroidota bacterium]